MIISLIAAMSENRVIGLDNHLPWQHIPADWENLFKVTDGKKMIMGRKSYDNPDRIWSKEGNIVITRQPNYVVDEGFIIANSLEKALEIYKTECHTTKHPKNEEEEIFILGGEEIFRQALPYADFIHLTIVHETFVGDTFFPIFDETKFDIIEKKDIKKGENSPYDITILVYEKIK